MRDVSYMPPPDKFLFDPELEALVPERPKDGELVWHYCGATALNNIVAKHELWASSVAFMNDAREVLTGNAELRAEYEKVKDTLDPLHQSAFEEWWFPSGNETMAPLGTYLLSASTDGDNLSLWRAYGTGDIKYAIGLDPMERLLPIGKDDAEDPHPSPGYRGDKFLETGAPNPVWDATIVTAPRWFLAKYSGTETNKLVGEVMEHVRRMVESTAGPDESETGWAGILRTMRGHDAVTLVAQQIKDAGFRDEREARLLMTAEPTWRFVYYRPSGLGFVPYIKLTGVPVGTEDDKHPTEAYRLPIRKIYIGPTQYPHVAKAGLTGLLAHFGYHDVEVLTSKVPYRSV